MRILNQANIKLTSGLLLVGMLFVSIFCSPAKALELDKVIRYCVDPNWFPYEAIKDGKHVGMSSDYLRFVEKKTALKFELFPTKNWNESLLLLKSGHCQLLPMLNKTAIRSQFLTFSEVYVESPNVLVSLKDQPFLQGFDNIGERKIALTKGYRVVEYINANYSHIEYELADSEKQGLQWLMENRVELFVGSMLTVNYHIYENQLTDLKIAGWVGTEDKLRMGVKHGYEALLPIINEALSELTEQEHLAIHQRWNQVRVVTSNGYNLYFLTLIIAIIIFSFFVYRQKTIKQFEEKIKLKNIELQSMQMSLEQTNQELEYLSNHDPLTKLYNRNYFNRTVAEELRHVKAGTVCLIVLDIDHFKYINDQHGHRAGDEILKSLSKILNNVVREQDIVARWGGEEFVILCHQSSPNDAYKLCERITEKIGQYQFPVVADVTCSFGLAQLKNDESIITCFERADQALYQAKAQGRDQICFLE